jgi:hypothetical protein
MKNRILLLLAMCFSWPTFAQYPPLWIPRPATKLEIFAARTNATDAFHRTEYSRRGTNTEPKRHNRSDGVARIPHQRDECIAHVLPQLVQPPPQNSSPNFPHRFLFLP